MLNNLAAYRRTIDDEEISLMFDEAGAAVGIARRDTRLELSGSKPESH
jgi:hypothetical protein